MKRLIVSKDSWHYKVARYGGLSDWDDSTDLCRYFWAFVWGLLKPKLLIAAGVVGGFIMVLCPAIFLLVWALTGHAVLLGPDLIGLLLWAFFLVLFVAHCAQEKPEIVPGAKLLVAGYRGWKEKTCVLIDVK